MENTERSMTILKQLDMRLVTAAWWIQEMLNNRCKRTGLDDAQGWERTLPEPRSDVSTFLMWFYFNGKRNLY